MEQQLREFGHKGRVLGLTQSHCEYYSMDLPRAKAMFKQCINREWGHHVARRWAALLLDRLRDYVGAVGGGSFRCRGVLRLTRARRRGDVPSGPTTAA